MSPRVTYYRQPGTYTWTKPKDLNQNHEPLPSFIVIEACSGGAGGASGSLTYTTDPIGQNAIGGSGGGHSMIVIKTYEYNEINDSIDITVGAGGDGGNATQGSVSNVSSLIIPCAVGHDGGQTIVGPINEINESIKPIPGKAGKYYGPYPGHMVTRGDYGAAPSFVGDNEYKDGYTENAFGYGGAAGACISYNEATKSLTKYDNGVSPGGGTGGDSLHSGSDYNGQNASDGQVYGSGGGGGGATFLTTAESGIAGNGGRGADGYVKITLVFTI